MSHWAFLSASFLAGDHKHRRFVSKMAEIIETESGIRALQAALVERRNKDRLGHIFCNLRLIIVPGAAQGGEAAREAAPSPPATLPLPGPARGEGQAGKGELGKEAHTQVGESSLCAAAAGERTRLGAGLRG